MEYRQHASVGVLRNDTYYKHVCAMTDEKLRDKSEIAEELAVRDMRIKELESQLAAMTKKADGFFDALQLAAKMNAEGQAREKQLREALKAIQHGFATTHQVNAVVVHALSLPQDDTALMEWGANLLEEMAMEIDLGTQETEDAAITLCRKADELEAGK